VIAGRVGQVLPHAQVSFGRLDGLVSERELDLLERDFAFVRLWRELREGFPRIMRGQFEPDPSALFRSGPDRPPARKRFHQ
jgi:hypothetical protein